MEAGVSITMEASFCAESLENALARHGKPHIFDTDQGSQFTGAAFTGVLMKIDNRISMDGKGAWRDNVSGGWLWRSVPYGQIHLRPYDSVSDTRQSIGRHRDLYNHRRPHSSLDGQTPDRAYYGVTRACRRSAARPEHGRRSTYPSGIPVRTTATTSVGAGTLVMRGAQEARTEWPTTLRWYLGVSFAAHLAWEVLQLPLYTLWTTGTLRQQAFAILHCTLGDVMIAGLSILAALSLFGRRSWPSAGACRVYLASLMLGVAYTIYSEWLNVSVRSSWSYAESMPIVPFVGTGLAPLLQWIVVPTAAQWIALGKAPWSKT